MNYQTSQIKPIHYPAIQKLPVPNQRQVIETTGVAFEALTSLKAISDASNNYSLVDESALEADQKMMEWLERSGFSIVDDDAKPSENQAKKANYEKTIKGFQILHDLTADNEKKSHYKATIKGFQILMDLL